MHHAPPQLWRGSECEGRGFVEVKLLGTTTCEVVLRESASFVSTLLLGFVSMYVNRKQSRPHWAGGVKRRVAPVAQSHQLHSTAIGFLVSLFQCPGTNPDRVL